jgi:hypothetical protein
VNNVIGTLNESSLHKDLKFRYSETGKTEIHIGDFVCDGQAKNGEYIEVQIGSFGPLKDKIAKLTKNDKLRVIYPIIVKTHIELYDINGKFVRKRKSPKKGCAWDVFNALLYAPELPINPRVTVELVFLDIIEKRKDDGKGAWRRKGITIEDRIPISWHESIVLKKSIDYSLFIPRKVETFTVKDLSDEAGISQVLARKCLYVLNKMGIIERVGKQGNAYIYKKR